MYTVEQEIITEFLIESTENLALLEREIVALEQRPRDPDLLASVFRTIHTVKGTCGFLDFPNMEKVAHIAENLLSEIRDANRDLTPAIASLVLETADAIRSELTSIEATGLETGETYEELRTKLTAASNNETPECPLLPSPPPANIEAEPGNGELTDYCDWPEQADSLPATRLRAEDPAKRITSKPGSVSDSTIRVDVGQLDKLMTLVGELVLARNQILQFESLQDDAILKGTAQRLNLITTQLQEGVMKTRMQPIGVVWNKLPRVVRDLASACGKQIELELEGAETELDKSIIEAIKDPLTHIVRNCCDHGIEPPPVRALKGKPACGRLKLRAFHEGGQVNIEITDDGGGINSARVRQKALDKGLLRAEQVERLSEREAINLVFLPGFSTAAQVTSISGRGVGMDVVKTNIEKIGGVVDLSSRAGEGTTVRIKIPLTLAIIPGLVVGAAGQRFIIPQVGLVELLRLEGQAGRNQIERIHGTPVYRRRGKLLPIIYLAETLRLPAMEAEAEAINIVVLQAEERQFGVVVDTINDTQEIVLKPLGKQLRGLTAYAGATIMGDGKVALILDVAGIGRLSGVLSELVDQPYIAAAGDEVASQQSQAFLLFRAGSFERLAVPLSSVARLEEFPASRIERAGGRLVIQYRNQILPLTPLASMLQGEPMQALADPAPVIVFSDGNRLTGLLVDEIIDIHQESICLASGGGRAKMSGSAVLGGKVTDFLDLPAVLLAADENWFTGSDAACQVRSTVLVADGTAFSRGLVRNYLELAGHPVVEAVDQADALERLGRNEATAVVTSLELPAGSGQGLLERMRSQADLTHIPVVALCKSPEEMEARGGGFDAFVDRFDREGLLLSLKRLSAALGAPVAQGTTEQLVGAER